MCVECAVGLVVHAESTNVSTTVCSMDFPSGRHLPRACRISYCARSLLAPTAHHNLIHRLQRPPRCHARRKTRRGTRAARIRSRGKAAPTVDAAASNATRRGPSAGSACGARCLASTQQPPRPLLLLPQTPRTAEHHRQVQLLIQYPWLNCGVMGMLLRNSPRKISRCFIAGHAIRLERWSTTIPTSSTSGKWCFLR